MTDPLWGPACCQSRNRCPRPSVFRENTPRTETVNGPTSTTTAGRLLESDSSSWTRHCGCIGPLLVGLVAGQWGLDAAAVTLAVAMMLDLVWLSAVVGETGGRTGDRP